ncbi:hypothetical protein CRG98_027363 [Punica granatum]|uniref:Uncharacterized protein n=1 Tax=Punica granatum TaxID=22663 RepID=A0A2I0J969_PUNGR|nr:hypothetical protein CRG98_027363 [Punica granatum]
MGYRREAKSPLKAQKGSQKGKETTSPEATVAGTVALFITESPKYRKASCLSQDTSRTLTDAFSNRAPGRPIHGRVNGTRERVCTHPRTTRTMEQVSGCLPSESRPGKGTPSNRIQRSELIRWNVDVRASHHSFPTTLRIREIISPRAKQISQASRVTFQWSLTPLGKSSEHVSDEQRPQRSSNT